MIDNIYYGGPMGQGGPMDLLSQRSQPQERTNWLDRGLNAATNRNMLPWLSMAFAPNANDQFKGMTDGIKYQDEARRQDDEAEQKRQLFDAKIEEYVYQKQQREEEVAREQRTNDFIAGRIVGPDGKMKYTAEQVGFLRDSGEVGRRLLERDLRLTDPSTANELDMLNQALQEGKITTEEYDRLRPGAIQRAFTGSGSQRGSGPRRNVPAGFEEVLGPDGEFQGIRPMAGSDAALERETSAQKAETAQARRELNASTQLDDARRIINLVDENPTYTTGMLGTVMKQFGQTDAGTVASAAKSLQANIGFDELQAMRMESPTGGALGQVSDREVSFLQALRGAIDQSNNDAEFKYNVARYHDYLASRVHGPRWREVVGGSLLEHVGAPPSMSGIDSNFQRELDRFDRSGGAPAGQLGVGQSIRAPNGATITRME